MESMTQIKLVEQPNIMALLQTLEDNKDLCEIVYWGVLFISSILMIYFYR